MNLKLAIATAGLVAIGLPLAVLANQPAVKVTQLEPMPIAQMSALQVLMLDPYQTTEFSVELPKGYATLDVDTDPFGPATVQVAAK